MIFGRHHEISIFRRAFNSSRAELGIVYGRRRVGKSALLSSLQKKGRDLYFEALQKVELSRQIQHFTDQLAEQTGTPRVWARSWKEAFDALTPHLHKGRRYVVFDEFPWMASGRAELVSLLKYYWDNRWKANSGLTLALCGSVSSFMLKHLVHSHALHNRKTFEMKVEGLPAREGALFFRGRRSAFEMSKFLMIFGGIPKYLEQIDPAYSLGHNMDRLCFTKNSFFLTEFETLFKEQFKVIKTYELIVEALARGSLSREALAGKLGKPPGGGLGTYIQALEQADFVKQMSPPAFDGERGKTRRIVLWDEWLRFYFTYVKPHRSAIELNTGPGLFDRLTGRSLDAYLGLCFERFCLKNIPSLLEHMGVSISEVIDVGPFFRQPGRGAIKSPGAQVDILIHRQGHILTVVECKFQTNPLGLSVARDVENKIRVLKPKRHFTIEKVLVSAGPLSRDLEKSGAFHKVMGLESLFAPPSV